MEKWFAKTKQEGSHYFPFFTILFLPSPQPLLSTRAVIRRQCAASGKESSEKIITLCLNQLVCS